MKAIVTYAAGAHCDLLAIALPTFQRFADAHGYKIVIGDKKTDRPASWNKIPLMLDALESFEEVLWLDADLVIVDPSENLSVPGGFSHALVRHDVLGSEIPNAGLWYARKSAKALLQAVWRLDSFTDHEWWEQAALMSVLGYTVPPVGSVFTETICRQRGKSAWHDRTFFLPGEWNSHPDCEADRPRVVHCSYGDMEQRLNAMKATALER